MLRKSTLFSVFFLNATLAFPEVDLSIHAGLERQENITRLPDGQEQIDDDALTYGTSFAYLEDRTHFESDLSYSITRQEYLDDSFEGRNAVLGRGYLSVRTANDAFSWMVENRVRDGLLDVLQAEIPQNLTRVNTLSTGPRVRLRLSGRDDLIFAATHTEVETENARADNTSDSASLVWDHQATRRLGISTSLSHTVTDADFSEVGEIKQQHGALRFDRTLRRGMFSVEGGYADATAEDVELDVSDNFEYRLALDLETDRGTVLLQAVKEITTTGLGTSTTVPTPFLESASDLFRLDVSESARIDYGLELLPERLSLGLNAATEENENQLRPEVTETDSVGAELTLRVGQGEWTAGVEWLDRFARREGVTGESEQMNYSIEYSRPLIRNLDISCGYELTKFDRETTSDIETEVVGCLLTYVIF